MSSLAKSHDDAEERGEPEKTGLNRAVGESEFLGGVGGREFRLDLEEEGVEDLDGNGFEDLGGVGLNLETLGEGSNAVGVEGHDVEGWF